MIRLFLRTLLLAILLVPILAKTIRAQDAPSASPQPSPPTTGKSYSAGEPIKAPPPTLPQSQSPVTFSNTATGVTFTRNASLTSNKYLLEAMGGGVAVFDYDNDGLLDLFFTNGAALKSPMTKVDLPEKRDPKFWNRLYHQKKDGSFEDVTQKAGVQGEGYSMGVAAADYDNDGFVDFYVTGYQRNYLYHNNGDGTFTEVAKKLGVDAAGWSSSAGWFDYDRDGRLDLFVGRYMQWDFESGSIYCGEQRPGYRAYCHPDNFPAVANILYHQRADGSFEDVSVKAGIAESRGKALGVAFADFDNDGYTDIFVANDSVRQNLFHNKKDGSFEDVAVTAGAGYDENGKTFAGMGIDVGDYDNDGEMDLFITTLSSETYPLYHNDGDLTFSYATNSTGVGQLTLLYSGWGTHFIDVNNDGWRDLFVAQGHVLDTIGKTNPYLSHDQPLLLMLNTGKSFVNISSSAGPSFNTPISARGAAFGDLNNDGQIDVVVGTLNGAALVLRNEGTKNHWLGLSLVGTQSNREGLGARVTVTDENGRKQIFDCSSAGSYLSSNDPRILVGLGTTAIVRSVAVIWPSGEKQLITHPQVDRYIVLKERAAQK